MYRFMIRALHDDVQLEVKQSLRYPDTDGCDPAPPPNSSKCSERYDKWEYAEIDLREVPIYNLDCFFVCVDNPWRDHLMNCLGIQRWACMS